MREQIKLLPVTEDVTEVQVWADGMFVGAGALSKPVSSVTEQDIEEAKRRIVEVWVCGC